MSPLSIRCSTPRAPPRRRFRTGSGARRHGLMRDPLKLNRPTIPDKRGQLDQEAHQPGCLTGDGASAQLTTASTGSIM